MAGRSPGQDLALEQLAATVRASAGSVALGAVHEPDAEGDALLVEVSLRCSHIDLIPGGLRLRARERFYVVVSAEFPFKKPVAATPHRRWAGTAHVLWGRQLCMYLSDSEWDPGAGMYGFITRLDLWLKRAAAGELDAEDAPLHPPLIYEYSGDVLFVARRDTPPVTDSPWFGFAQLETRNDFRKDIVEWSDQLGADSALAILLAEPFTWEYPKKLDDLLLALEDQGIARTDLWGAIVRLAARRAEGSALHIVLGTPMRRGSDQRRRQHLAVWEIEPALVDKLRNAAPKADDPEEVATARRELAEIHLDIARSADLRWCGVSEARPEIAVRRDESSPLPAAVAGKTVAIWGCGAIGAHVAEWIARAGAARIVLYDKDVVTPGVLVRQPFTDSDIAKGKARMLKGRLEAISPGLPVEAHMENILTTVLGRDQWDDGADIVIDATASAVVRLKLEALRARTGARCPVIAMAFGHTAERGLAVVVPPDFSGGVEDVLRRVKIACAAADHLTGFADDFWPTEERAPFQPEPGCSDATFRGSGAEVAALSATLLHSASQALVAGGGEATAHLFALPSAVHAGWRSAEFRWGSSLCLDDGVGNYEIRLAPEALAEIRAWVARNDRALDRRAETGGILYGRRDEPSRILWIDTATGPPPDSVADPGQFVCGTLGVAEMTAERKRRTRGEVNYVGMWHTHPNMTPDPSSTDLQGMLGLVASEPVREAVMLIVGGRHQEERLAGYLFNGDRLQSKGHDYISIIPRPCEAPSPPEEPRDVGLALSGGGSRAVAFHLGCLRALHDRNVLRRVRVASGVSGGALMTALWAYGPDRFDEFDEGVVSLLRSGLQRDIARRALMSRRLPQGLASSAAGSVGGLVGGIARRPGGAPLRRWSSRTDAFADVLRELLGDRPLSDPRREGGLDVVINACDLRTGHAFRFGSRESGSWQLGRVAGNDVDLATAVAASAAYPLAFPALDREWTFERRDGTLTQRRVVLTDGGVFDNLGTSCLRPGRSSSISYNVYPVEYVISCDAGRGQLADSAPFHMLPRIARSFEASFRKLQDAGRAALHQHVAHGELKGFVMPYLGQQDGFLPWQPPDLITRERVCEYPTNFAAMSPGDIELLAGRGEQLTRMLIERWSPEL
jgi:integrative and conjugative element protein (TIGR02256 family)